MINRHLIENTATGELQEVENFDAAALGPDELNRGAIPTDIPVGLAAWDGAAIVVDLAPKRMQLHAAVKALREAHEYCGVTVPPYGTFDSDPESQRKINGSVTMAILLDAAFTLDWRRADNTIVTLDKTGMIAVGLAVGQHVSACQDRKNALDDAIEAATALGDLAAIDLNMGWPA